ncbi:hypothetical protein PANI_CDS0031 [Maribacter phage Panino]
MEKNMDFYQKHLARQKDLKEIHERAIRETPKGGVDENLMCIMRVKKTGDGGKTVLFEESVLRRGYKIQHTPQTDMYELFKTTSTDYYKYVDDTIIDEFLEKGFVRAVDEHQIKRDRRRVELLNRKIDKANSERNDSLIIHWRNKRKELIEKISKIEETL